METTEQFILKDPCLFSLYIKYLLLQSYFLYDSSME